MKLQKLETAISIKRELKKGIEESYISVKMSKGQPNMPTEIKFRIIIFYLRKKIVTDDNINHDSIFIK